jgi:hypothetical protein
MNCLLQYTVYRRVSRYGLEETLPKIQDAYTDSSVFLKFCAPVRNDNFVGLYKINVISSWVTIPMI